MQSSTSSDSLISPQISQILTKIEAGRTASVVSDEVGPGNISFLKLILEFNRIKRRTNYICCVTLFPMSFVLLFCCCE